MTRRFVQAMVGGAVAVAVMSAPAGAVEPEGTCATGWELFSTEGEPFLQDLDAKGNEDGFVCLNPAVGANPLGHRGTVTDNRIPI